MLILNFFLKGAFCRKVQSPILVGLLNLAASSAQAIIYFESPVHTKRVEAGEIKPVAERLPKQPLFVRFKGSKKVPDLIRRLSQNAHGAIKSRAAHDRLRLRAPHALRRALQCDARYYETHSGR